jgi:hypothetical protein
MLFATTSTAHLCDAEQARAADDMMSNHAIHLLHSHFTMLQLQLLHAVRDHINSSPV